MFIVLLTYDAELGEIDRLMPEHVAFLKRCYDADLFLVSGRQVPRTGGVILARSARRQDVEAVMELDPLVEGGAARFEIIEFRTSQFHPDFESCADGAPPT